MPEHHDHHLRRRPCHRHSAPGRRRHHHSQRRPRQHHRAAPAALAAMRPPPTTPLGTPTTPTANSQDRSPTRRQHLVLDSRPARPPAHRHRPRQGHHHQHLRRPRSADLGRRRPHRCTQARVRLRRLGRKTELTRPPRPAPCAQMGLRHHQRGQGSTRRIHPLHPAGNAYTNKVTAYDNLYRRIKTATVIASEERSRRHLSDRRHHHKPSGADRQLKPTPPQVPARRASPAATAGKTLRLTHSVYGQGMTTPASATPDRQAPGLPNGPDWLGARGPRSQHLPAPSGCPTPAWTAPMSPASTAASPTATTTTATSAPCRTSTATAPTQCFNYDYLNRLSDAWTQNTTSCAAAPTSAQIGGTAPVLAVLHLRRVRQPQDRNAAQSHR